jgi:ligand-binding sensor domain-containing protein
MKSKTLVSGMAFFLAVLLDACGGATPVHFDSATLDPSQAAYLTVAAAWPTTTPSQSPTLTSAFTATAVTPSSTPTTTINPATIPIPADSHPEWTYYLGSPNDISHIAVDPEGRYVWAVTKGGVVRWDSNSNSSTLYTRNNGLPDNNVTDIGITPDGRVWVGTLFGGLAAYDGSGWKWYTTQQGLLDNGITEINVSPEGDLWIGYVRDGVSRFDGSEWTNWKLPQGGKISRTTYIDLGDPRRVVVYTLGSSFVYDGEKWGDFHEPPYYFTIVDVAITKDGTKWFAASEGGVFMNNRAGLVEVKGDKNILHSQCEHVRGNHAYSIVIDNAGVMWVGTDDGLVRFDGANWGSYTVQEGLPSNMIKDIAIGSDGRLWVGTDRGLALMGDNPLHWTVLTAADGQPELLSNSIGTMAFDASGILWISLSGYGANDGIYRFDGLTAMRYPEKDLNIINRKIERILPSSDGSVWIITNSIILNYNANQWKQFYAQKDFPFSHVEASTIDADGRLWIGEAHAIAFLDGGKWKKIDISTGTSTSPEKLQSMTVAKDGSVWVGTKQGLYQYRDGVWSYLRGATAISIDAMLSDSNGGVWAVSGSKVLVYDGNEWQPFEGNHFFTGVITCIAASSGGKIYFGTNYQMVIFDGQEAKAFGPPEGFPYTRPTAITVRSDDSVWIGTDTGVMVYHPT